VHVIKSLEAANMRKIASRAALEAEIALLDPENDKDKIEELKKQKDKIPWIDDFDLRYKTLVKDPVPISKAVMVLLLDVSSSITEKMKDRAKRFFYLVYLFLTTQYRHVDIVFLIHTTNCIEVTEEEFFNTRVTGGTEFLNSFEKVEEILTSRYDTQSWNVYLTQVSDGDVSFEDGTKSAIFLNDKLLPIIQFYAYCNVTMDDVVTFGVWYGYIRKLLLHTANDKKARFCILDSNKSVFRALEDLFKHNLAD